MFYAHSSQEVNTLIFFGREAKSLNNKRVFYNKIVGPGPGNYSFPEIPLNHVNFTMSFLRITCFINPFDKICRMNLKNTSGFNKTIF